jgi:hypothetical protein
MTTRNKYILAAVGLLAAFASGRYSVQAPTVKTQVTQQATTDTQADKDTHRETTTITEKQPDGVVKTTTKVTEDIVAKKDTESKIDTRIQQTVTPPEVNMLNISLLAGIDFSRQVPVYGASINKQLLSVFTIGAFGLSNGTIGASVGLNF